MSINNCNLLMLESEERYRHLVQMLPDAVVVIVDYRLVFANDSALRLFKIGKLEGVVGVPINQFVHPDYLERMPANVELLLRESGPLNLPVKKLLRMDGIAIDVEIKAVVVTYNGKRGIQLLIRDLTDRIRMEASLNEKEHLYKTLVENTVAGVFVAAGENISYMNPHFAEIFGYTPEEFVNVKVHDLLEDVDLDRIKHEVAEGISQNKTKYHLKMKGRRKDGSIIHIEGSSSLTSLNGEEIMLGIVQDVTFKQEQEQQLRKSALMYQKIIKFIPEAIVLTDNEQVVYANKLALKLIGVKDGNDVIGQSVLDFIHPNYHERTIMRMDEIMLSEEIAPFNESIVRCVDGRFVDVEISSIRINDYMGKNVLLSVIRDLTNRKQSEEMLVRSEKLSVIGQLAAGVAHEIRNPLTALKGFTQLLQSKYNDHSHYFDIMAGEIDRINLIVNEFMTLAKPHFSQFNSGYIEPILQSVLSILETQAILLNVEIKVKLEPELPAVFCNENQLKQVFLNVIKNAIEAMPSGGVVDITAVLVTDSEIGIRIKDEGQGIPEELIAKIGEPFVTTKEKGTGLGLMISTRIIEAHNGTLHLFSKQNEGTTIEIRLPAQDLRQ
ncbi:PAS domain-containing sensor histidine kinase [Paenibacillus harenae]|uniref:PAS domain-containing sensor histidine kinase n=1 Tax=Paenibacillus harenae TaxID=306543 RepID=UPI0027D7BF7C|nr:PAS domain-containing sensor histidine kinase [Paenibacillus harenae]